MGVRALAKRLFKPLLHKWRLRGARSRQEQIELRNERIKQAEGEALEFDLDAEAHYYANTIRDELTRLGICYRYTVTEKKHTREKIQEAQMLWPYKGTKEKIELKIDGRRFPRGHNLVELTNSDVLESLSHRCKHRVLFRRDVVDAGAWFVIERESGVGGIPRYLSFDDAMLSRPATLEDDRLAFPVGIAENRKVVWRSLKNTGNILIAGSPGKGKSNFANSLLCTLLKANGSDQLKLLLVDLKGGLELSFYAGLEKYLLKIPAVKVKRGAPAPPTLEEHADDYNPENDEQVLDDSEVADPGEIADVDYVPDRRAGMVPAFIERREHVPAALSYIIGLLEERNEILKKAGVKKLSEYNKKMHMVGKHLPAILCVIDEWADVKLTPRVGSRAEERLINITNRGRAAGIYVVLCTQSPNKDVLSTRVTNAMNTKMVFRTTNQYMSMALLSDYSAATLEPVGRAVFVDGSDRHQVQAAHIPNEMVETIVAERAGGAVVKDDRPKPKHDVTDTEIFEWALNEQDGQLKIKEMCDAFNHRGFSQMKIRAWLKEKAGREVEIDGSLYKIHPGSRIPPLPTRILPVTHDVEGDVDNDSPSTNGDDSAAFSAGNGDVAMLNVDALPVLPDPVILDAESGEPSARESVYATDSQEAIEPETYGMGTGDATGTLAGNGREHDGHFILLAESETEAVGLAV